jgi:hypothetical protein
MQGKTIQEPTAKDPVMQDPFELGSTMQDPATRLEPMTQDSIALEAMDEDASVPGPTSQELEQLLAAARERLDGLVSALRAVDAELEGLAPERKQHQALQSFCSAFEQLNEAGAATLFWGDRRPSIDLDERLRAARERLTAFDERIGEIESRRRARLDEINEQQEHAQWLEDDVFEALEEEERIKHEWIIEREIDSIRAALAMESWTQNGEDDRRFRKTATNALLACLAFALILPWIPLPTSEPEDVADVPERVITMMMQEKPKPKPIEVPVTPPKQIAQQKPIEKVEPPKTAKPTAQEPKPDDAPGPAQGILAFREKLDSFKDAPLVALGAQAKINNADNSSARPERSMLTTNAPGSSGGIHLAALSRNFGNGGDERGAIQGAALTRASSKISASGGNDRPLSDGAILGRTDEEIQIVFDRYKAALYRLYNRELRKDPTLQGKMILRLTIEPDGSVSACALHATDMHAPELAEQVVGKVRTFDFGAKEVPAITIVYPIDFLPAT